MLAEDVHWWFGEFDTEIESYIRSIRLARGILNAFIVMTGAKEIITHSKPSLLPEHGGSLDLGKMWAQSFLCWHGYVKRKATKAARKLPADYLDLKLAFLERIICYWEMTVCGQGITAYMYSERPHCSFLFLSPSLLSVKQSKASNNTSVSLLY